MQFGIDNALNEITLVLFTTMAPSGAVACAGICCILLFCRLEEVCRSRISQFLWIPILVALIGLVASATHLGNPSNALYVLSGIGRSPLSNEVFAAVIGFGLAGGFWLYSFAQVRHPVLERIWLVATTCGALGFALSIAFAYNVETIITWSQQGMKTNLLLNSIVGGSLLSLLVFVTAERSFDKDVVRPLYNFRIARTLIVLAALALAVNIVSYLVQGPELLALFNSTVSAAELTPHYYPCVTAFAILCASGIALDAHALFCKRSIGLPRAICAVALSFCGIFVMRFVFYAIHMTVGISL